MIQSGAEPNQTVQKDFAAGQMQTEIAGTRNASTEPKTSKNQSKRIVLTTFGSLGDLLPYMAIAQELQARGHRPAIAANESQRRHIEARGLEFHPLRPESEPKIEQDWDFFKMISDSQKGTEYLIGQLLMPHQHASYSDLMQACQGADLLLTHPLTFVASIIVEKTGIPWVSSVLSPASLISAYDLPANVPTSASPYERALAAVAKDTALRSFRWNARLWSAPVRQLRAQLGLLPSGDPIFESQHSPNLVLALFSRALASPPPDWPPQTLVTGFPFCDRPAGTTQQNEQLSPELENFLNSGPPPIVFTLGTTAVWMPGNFYAEGAVAAQKLGYRAILLMGGAANHIPPGAFPEGVAAFDYAPHSQLFPRAAAIVHHGGVGTTGQAMRSGRPTLIVPHNYDQPDNAERIARLGAGRTLTRDRCTAATLTAELQQLLFNPSYAARAAQLSQIVNSENGAATACDALLSLAR